MGEHIVVMRDGHIQQTEYARFVRPPREPLRRRIHRFSRDEFFACDVAPQWNLARGVVLGDGTELAVARNAGRAPTASR